MQVKKFEAPTMQEALKVIKRELGPEAIILSTKHIKSGFGLMSKASVEVTAAIAEKDLHKKQAAEKNLPQNVKEKIWGSSATKQAEIYDDYFEKQLKRGSAAKVQLSSKATSQQRAPEQAQPMQTKPHQPARSAALPTAAQQIAARAPVQQQHAVQSSSAPRERRYIDIGDDEQPTPNRDTPAYARAGGHEAGNQQQVKNLQADIEQLKSMVVELASGASARDSAREETDSDLSEGLAKALQDLVSAGIEKKLARQLVRTAAFELNPNQLAEDSVIQEKIAEQLMSEIQVGDLLAGVGASAGVSTCSVVTLVGPTGVGKTTTIAKIASLGILEKKLRVGLINLDSYKVAAADQLHTYAKIMNVPFRSVNSKEELNQAIYDFSSLDLVLIDTTGRSQKDQESLLQLRHMLAGIERSRNVLMVSATTKDSDIHEVVSRFKIFNPAGMVFSKLDETSVYGCIYNVQRRSGLPLLYFTVGQRVPEDIEKASGERLVDLILDL